MKSLSLKTAILVTLVSISNAAEGQMPPRKLKTCGVATPNIEVQLKLDYGSLTYDEGQSLRSVAGAPSDAMGLTLYQIGHSFRMEHDTRNQNCIRIKKVEVSVKVETLKVLIDSSLPNGSCKYLKTKEHENEHVRIIRSTLKEQAPSAKMNLVQKLSSIQPIEASKNFPDTYITAVTDLQDQVEVMVRDVIKEMERKVEDNNDAIDTSKSYRTILKDCL